MSGQLENQPQTSLYRPKSEQYDEKAEREELVPGDKGIGKSVLLSSIAICGAAILLSIFTKDGYRAEGSAEQVVKNRISSTTNAGETLFNTEINAGIQPKDYEVNGMDGVGNAKMLIWDFNKEDLDEIQILVDGQPVKESLILNHNPAAIGVPVPSTVTVKGLKDNGGGISYAVKFPNNKKTYFNVVPVGSTNTYRVLPK